MKKHNILPALLAFFGIALIACALAFTALWYVSQTRAMENIGATVSSIESLMPTVYPAFPDDISNTAMPAVQVGSKDFVGIVEFPAVSEALPIYARWDKKETANHPCRFFGNTASRDLIIGGSDNRGQLDFINDINMGDEVIVTDMTGGAYSYRITYVERMKDASYESLTVREADLVVFAKNTYSLDFTVVFCEMDFKTEP